jgi:RNA polymerase sigma-70 factor, ECF subfamily
MLSACHTYDPERTDGEAAILNNGTVNNNESVQQGPDEAESRERALLAAARSGDLHAFGELTERYRSTCLKRAMLILRNRSDAEDEVQNAFWKALQRLDQYRGEGAFAAWLGRIVENQCLMRLRDERSSRSVCLDETPESKIGVELIYQLASPEDQLGTKEVVSLLRREILRIPPLLRRVMMLHDLDQLPMSDVAFRLGVSVPAAKSRLMRARGELKSRITKHCGRKGAGTLMQVSRYSQAVFKRAS